MSFRGPGCGHSARHRSPALRADDLAGAELVKDVVGRLAVLGWTASAAGAAVVFLSIGFLIPIFIEGDDRMELALINAPMVAAYVVVVGLLIRHFGDRHNRETLAWIAEDRPASGLEHKRTLNLAVHGVKLSALGWLGGAVVFFAITSAMHGWAFGAVVGGAIWLGGETTCALVYLASERILRPVTACALAQGPSKGMVAPGVRGRLVGAWALGTGVPLLGVLVVAIVGITKSDVDVTYVAEGVLFLGVVAWVTGTLATLFASKAIADPLTSVRRGLERIEEGDLDTRVAVDDGSEVGLLQAGFNQMADGLRERERIRDLFGRQVGEDVARAALNRGTRLGGEEREIGALFVDVVGSTSMAIAMPATEVVKLLNRFFRVVVDVVEAEGALVNKFEGDAALCVFGAPVPREDPAGDALRAARKLDTRLRRDMPEIDFGIGISAGMAVAGNVGAERRFEYTVIGDPVNEAARLSELAKRRPERVLASESALARADAEETAGWTVGDSEVLRGRNVPTGVAHPVG